MWEIIRHETEKKNHIQWILVGLLFGIYDIYFKRMRNIYPAIYIYRTMGAICVSPLPHNNECTYVQHPAEYLWTYFSEDTGISVYWICRMDPIKIYSNIRFQIISSWSDICNICLSFYRMWRKPQYHFFLQDWIMRD